MSIERRGCRGGAKKRARFAIKSPIKLLNGPVVHKGTKSKRLGRASELRPKEGSKSFRGYFHNGHRRKRDGRPCHRERFVPARAVLRLAQLFAT